MSFGAFFFNWVDGEDKDNHLQKYSRLTNFFGASAVQVVWYERLLEVNQSLQSYVICNATLGRVGASWAQCDKSVNSKNMITLMNSVDPRTVDVVRLARGMFYQYNVTNGAKCKFDLVARDPQVKAIARRFPEWCFSLDRLHYQMTEVLYNLEGVDRPSERSDRMCVLNEAALKQEHWRLIKSLLPNCVRS
eukprot:s1635_g20.t1